MPYAEAPGHRTPPRMSMYRTVLAEGQRDDLITLLNQDPLIAQWPVLRTLVSRHIRHVWEDAFPALANGRPSRRDPAQPLGSPERCRCL
jgi:hypothetical protein